MKRVVVLLLLLSCADAKLEAVEPVWGNQQCAHCAMLVSAKAPAAQAVVEGSNRRLFFDDLGCMVAWELREHPHVVAQWVRADERWVDPAGVHFSPGHSTPMDFGFLAEPSGALSFDDVKANVRDRLAKPQGGPP